MLLLPMLVMLVMLLLLVVLVVVLVLVLLLLLLLLLLVLLLLSRSHTLCRRLLLRVLMLNHITSRCCCERSLRLL